MLRELLSLIFIVGYLGTTESLAYEKAEAFIVKIYDKKVRVLSPTKYDEKLTVIIENKTLTHVRGKLETASKRNLEFISIPPQDSVSVSVKRLKTERIFFIPLAPPFQKVELKLGNKPYEIPPEK